MEDSLRSKHRILFLVLVGLFLSQCGSNEDDIGLPTYSFSFQGSEFDPHNDQVLYVAVVERSQDQVLIRDSVTVKDGVFAFEWEDLFEESKDYFLDYYVDMNGNGVCDEPQTDHSWRVKIDNVNENLSFTDTHHLDFKRVCHSFSDESQTEDSDTEIQISGQINLSDGISDFEGLSPGAALEGATVFVEGYPESEAKTDSQGVFSLKVKVPTNSLTANNYQVVIWYTEANKNSSIITWDSESVRVGAKKGITFDGTDSDLDLGVVDLVYTKKVKMTIEDASSLEKLSNCWVEVPAYEFQLIVKPKGDGIYLVDYLPEGSYQIRIDCQGYEQYEMTIQVGSSASFGEVQELEAVSLTPAS